MPAITAEEALARRGVLPVGSLRRFSAGVPAGLRLPGNIDLMTRPKAESQDGSTVKSFSVGTDEGEVLLPLIRDDGFEMTPDEAVAQYRRTGLHLGIFESPSAATMYARQLHAQQEALHAPKPKADSALDIAAAAFRAVSPISNYFPGIADWMAREMEGSVRDSVWSEEKGWHDPDWLKTTFKPVPGYSALMDPNATRGLTGAEVLLLRRAGSPEEVRFIRQQISRARKDTETLARNGGKGLAALFAASALDPFTLAALAIPLAAPAGATRAIRVAKAVGAVMAVDIAGEVMLHSGQPERTLKDSLFFIGADAVLSGALGAWATRLPKDEFKAIAAAVEESSALQTTASRVSGRGSAGAASAAPLAMTPAEAFEPAKGGKWLARTFGRGSPLDRLLARKSQQARALATRIVSPSFRLRGNVTGDLTNPVALSDITQAREQVKRVFVHRTIAAAYAKYAERVGAAAISERQFLAEVSLTARNGGETTIPEAKQVIDATREGLFRPDKADIVEHKVLGDEVEAADLDDDYMIQAWDLDTIAADPVGFRQFLTDTFTKHPLLPDKTKDIVAAESRLTHTNEGDWNFPETLASVVAARGAREGVKKAGKAVRDNSAAIADAGRDVRKAERVVEDATRHLDNLTAQRAALLEDMAGASPERLAKEEARLDRQIEKAKERILRADAERAAKQQKAIEAEQQHADLRVAAKEARATYKQTAKLAEKVRADANLVRQYYRDLEKAQTKVLEPHEMRARVDSAFANVTGLNKGVIDLSARPSARNFRERKIPVAKEDAARASKYMQQDFGQMVDSYIRGTTAHIEAARYGFSKNLDEEISAVAADYAEMRKAVEATLEKEIAKAIAEHGANSEQAAAKVAKLRDKANKEIAEIDTDQAGAMNDLTGLRDRLYHRAGVQPGGKHMQWVRAARVLRHWSYGRLLGMQAPSSAPDIGKIFARYGIPKTSRRLADLLAGFEANRLTVDQAKKLGTAFDWELDTASTAQTLGEITEQVAGGQGILAKMERGGRRASNLFTRVTGMATVNSTVKSLAATLESDAIISLALKGDAGWNALTDYQKAGLRMMSVDEPVLRDIAAEYAKHGEKVGSLYRPATEAWGNRDAAVALEIAAMRAADIMTSTRNIGDLPLLMDAELAKSLLQFKSFGMSSVNRTMIPMAQGIAHGDMNAVFGASLMLSLGAARYMFGEIAAGREPNLDPKNVAFEAMNWSGLFGFAPDLADPLLALAPGELRHLRGSKYRTRGTFETFLGPTVGTIGDAFAAISNLTEPTSENDPMPSITANDIHMARKLVWGQNVFYWRQILNGVEGEVAEALNAEGATRKSFVERVTELKEPRQ